MQLCTPAKWLSIHLPKKKKKTTMNSDINANDVEEKEDQCYDDDFEEDEDRSPNIGDSSNNIFALAEEHPSHKYMAFHKRKNIAVPQINSTKLLPNIKDLVIHEPLNQSDEVISQREQYAKIALLLFHPFRVHSDLVIDNYYWKKYNDLVITKKFWPKGLEILQKFAGCYVQLWYFL